jgi:ribosomal protein S6--L-glutamate ligase
MPPDPKGAPRSKKRRTVAVLSRKRSLYSTSRMVEAIRARGHRPIVLDTLRCNLILERGAPRMVYRGVEVRGVDVVIPRIGASITSYGLAVVHHLGMMGVPVVNSSDAIARSRDKLRCLQILAQNGLDVPRTVMARDRSHVEQLVEQVGGLPAIIKLIRGTQGVGVMIASSLTEVKSMLDTFSDLGQDIVLQEFVAESKGRDVRALVIGEKVVGAMRRQARRGEFRSNLHRGGEGRPIALAPEYARAAVEAARVIGLEVAGVDMLESKSGPKVMEINSSPGFEGLEKATGMDVAGAIVEHALGMLSRPKTRGGQPARRTRT